MKQSSVQRLSKSVIRLKFKKLTSLTEKVMYFQLTEKYVEVAEPGQVFVSMPVLRTQTERQDRVQEMEGL